MSGTNKIRYFCILTLAAFLVNVLLPFFAIYTIPSANAGAPPQASLFGEKILICTTNGFRWVLLADLQNNKQQPHKKYQCALCYIAMQGSTDAIPTQKTILTHQHLQYLAFSIADTGAIGLLDSLAIRTRAPPHLA